MIIIVIDIMSLSLIIRRISLISISWDLRTGWFQSGWSQQKHVIANCVCVTKVQFAMLF